MSDILHTDVIHTGQLSRRSAATGDTTAPVVTSQPQNGQGADAPLVFVFSEPIKLGSGTITLRANNGLSYTETIAGSPYVSVSGNTLSFKPPQRLAYATGYSVEISANAVLDLAGNPAHNGSSLYAWFISGLSPVALNLTGTSGADTLEGSDLADTMDGLGGEDTLNGYGGDDVLTGGDEIQNPYYGSGDRLNGGAGNDTLYGGGGTDWLWGGDGNDRLYGGADNDNLNGDAGDDLLDGGAGNDSLSGGTGNNILSGGDGDDTLATDYGSSGSLAGDAGNDRLSGYGGATEFDGGTGNDEIALRLLGATAGHTVVRGGEGNDTVRINYFSGTEATVTMSGGAGVDTYALEAYSNLDGKVVLTVTDFSPGAGGDMLDLLALFGLEPGVNPFDSGQMRLLASGSDTLLQLRDGADPARYTTLVTLTGVQPAQLTAANFSGGIDPRGGTLGVTLTGSAGQDTLRGMLLDDSLYGLDGADNLDGGGGNDLLEGGAGNDTLDGGAGSNVLRGGDGDDTLNSSSIGGNLLDGGAGNDRIHGGNGSDTLLGGAGDDELWFQSYGGAGRVVTMDGGDGADILNIGYTAGQVTLVASGGAGGDSFVVASYTAMRITDFGAGDRIDLRPLLSGSTISGNPFGAAGYLNAVQEGSSVRVWVDADGAAGSTYGWQLALSLDNTQLATLSGASFTGGFDPSGTSQGLHLTGTPGPDVLKGESLNDTIDGGDGADTIDGGAGDDQLYGGDESVLGMGDNIQGGAGDDLLRGGAGSDRLDGGDGKDLLYGDSGDDQLDGGAGDDRLEGGDGRDNLSDNQGSDYLSGGAGDDVLNSNWGYQDLPAGTTLDGGDGNDTMNAGSTVRTVLGGAGDDQLRLDARASAVNTAVIEVDMGEGKDRILFEAQYGESRAVRVTGGAGSDTYSFNPGERWPLVSILDFQTGAGGDVLDLFSFSYNWAAGNPFGAAGHARLVQDGSRVLFQLDLDGAAGPQAFATRIVFENTQVAAFTSDNFTDGARPDGSPTGLTLTGTAVNDQLDGGRLDDTLRGGAGGDALRGNAGNDGLFGEDGDDQLDGGAGNDRLDGGIGNDSLDGGEGNDELLGGAGNDRLVDSYGDNTLRGGDGDDTLEAWAGHTDLYGDAGNDQLIFYRGSGLADGGAGDDRIWVGLSSYDATAQAVEVRGGDGNDTVYLRGGSKTASATIAGGSGSDTYVTGSLSLSMPATVTDFTAGAGGDLIDVSDLLLSTSGNPFAANGSVRLLQRGADTVLQGRAAASDTATWQDVLVLRNTDKAALTPANFVFGFNPDGSSTGLVQTGSAAAEHFAGGWLDDTIDGAGGNDVINGSMGNDRLSGGDGDDQLDGDKIEASPRDPVPLAGTGHDRLEGGAGNDVLTSSWGNDVLLGGAGDDLLQVTNQYWVPGDAFRVTLDGGDGNDRLRVTASMSPMPALDMTGGAGSDVFELVSAPYGSAWTILDFQAGAGGDVLDLFAAHGWMRQNPFASGDARLVQRGADTVVQVDLDGAGVGAGPVDLVTLKNVVKETLTAANIRNGYAPDGTPVVLAPEQRGSAGAERLDGDVRANLLYGEAGNDVLAGYGGNDLLSGGAGRDTAVFGGARAQYGLAWRSDVELLVSDQRQAAPEGQDRLLDIERLAFADGAIALDTGYNGVAGQAYRIYRAAFDRTPDEGGVGFWIAMMDRGTTLNEIAGGFVRSQEFTDLYGAAPTNAEIVTRMYTNILDRAPEQAGYDYWLAALDNKLIDVASMLAMFSESNENQWAVAQLIAGGVNYQPYG
jgi:Ca2+-binding RTX toxin-like protein